MMENICASYILYVQQAVHKEVPVGSIPIHE